MTTLGVLAGTGLAIALVAGCAGHQTGAGPGGAQPGAGAPSATSAPHPGNDAGMPNVKLPDGSTPVAGSQVDGSSLPPGYPRLVWTVGDGTTVGFFGQQGGCSTVSAQVPAQNNTQVVIRLIQQEQARTKPCPMYLRYQPLSVRLAQPLGKRTVVLQNAIERG